MELHHPNEEPSFVGGGFTICRKKREVGARRLKARRPPGRIDVDICLIRDTPPLSDGTEIEVQEVIGSPRYHALLPLDGWVIRIKFIPN